MTEKTVQGVRKMTRTAVSDLLESIQTALTIGDRDSVTRNIDAYREIRQLMLQDDRYKIDVPVCDNRFSRMPWNSHGYSVPKLNGESQ